MTSNVNPTLLFPGSAQAQGVVLRNASVAAQVITAATLTQITGTKIKVPPGGLKAGSIFRAIFNMTKTAAGTATSAIAITFGTVGDTTDTAQVSFTKPAGTAAADEGVVKIEAQVRTVTATGVVVGEFEMTHNLAATGHAQIPCVVVNTVSSGFDNTSEQLYVAVVITTGASDAVTIQQARAELVIPTNGQG